MDGCADFLSSDPSRSSHTVSLRPPPPDTAVTGRDGRHVRTLSYGPGPLSARSAPSAVPVPEARASLGRLHAERGAL